jgi:PAS domain S-box-containing protein
MVLDASTDLVAHNNPSLVLQGMDIALPELGTGIMSHVDGQEALYARQDIFLGGQRFTILSQQLSSEALALAQDIRTIAGVALALTLVVVAGLAWYVVRYVVKPVEEMANIAYQLTQGDLSRQVRIEGAGEIATLGVTLNTLVDRLRSSITELKDTQDRYRTVADFTADWTYWEKPDGSLQYVSPVSQQIIGYAPEELQAQPELIHRLILPEDRAQWEAHYDRPDISEAVRRIQFRIRHRDGSVRWIEHTSRPVYDAAGDFDGYRVSNADITQRRLMEDALRTKHQELESFFRLAPDLLVIATIDGRFARVNRAWETVLGYRTDQIEGNPIADFVHPDDLDSTQQALSLLREQNPIERFTNRYRHADGSYRIIEWASQPAGDFIYAAAKDVTEREKAAAYADEIIRLRASFEREQEYSALIQQVVSALSHDVRTPLAAILMARDLLANYSERMTPQQRQEKLASIGEQINYALALVDDTMRVLRGSASEIQFNPRPVNIVALCRVSLDGVKANDAIDHNYTFR